MRMKLEDLDIGETATVVKVGGEGTLRKRILDLGITKGCKVRLLRVAPFGDPIEIELRGYRLTVRKTEASVVEVEGDACAPEPTGLVEGGRARAWR